MATSDNYLTSIKRWLKLHSNLKERDTTEDKRANTPVSRLATLKRNPRGPGAGAAGG